MESRQDRTDDHRRAAAWAGPYGGRRSRRRAQGLAGLDGGASAELARSVRANARRALRQVFARTPCLPDADKAPWLNMLDETRQQLHDRQRHRAPLVAVGVV